MKRILAILFCLIAPFATAAPFLYADPIDASFGVTECGVSMDAAAKVYIPITPVAPATVPPTVQCKHDLASLGNGAHSVKLTHRSTGSAWGDLESADSLPFSFVKPGNPAAPINLGVKR